MQEERGSGGPGVDVTTAGGRGLRRGIACAIAVLACLWALAGPSPALAEPVPTEPAPTEPALTGPAQAGPAQTEPAPPETAAEPAPATPDATDGEPAPEMPEHAPDGAETPAPEAESPEAGLPAGPLPVSPAAGPEPSPPNGTALPVAPAAAVSSAPSAPDVELAAEQGAQATSSAVQEQPGNEHVDVRIGGAGDGGGVTQQNAASSEATAQATLDVSVGPDAAQEPAQSGSGPSEAAPAPPGGSGETAPGPAPAGGALPAAADVVVAADAAAATVQRDPTNTSVSVRVGSPGDNGPVTQANAAAATAAAAAAIPAATGPATTDAAQHRARAEVEQLNPTNTNVVVRVFAPGDDGPVEQTNVATAVAAADGGTTDSSAVQRGAQNTNVVIRIGSPGHSGPAIQDSSATATTGAHGDDAVAQDALGGGVPAPGNTDLHVVVDGSGLADPSEENPGFAAWFWKWTWTSTEDSGPSRGTADPSSPPGAWVWEVRSGAEATRVGDRELRPGDWIWTWRWDRPGDWEWSWSAPSPLDCNCAWVWDWSWSWESDPAAAGDDGQGAAGTPDPARTPAPDVPTIVQANTAEAVAQATTAAALAQAGEHGELTATVSQAATADADVVQLDATNRWWHLTPAVQRNDVDVAAEARAVTDLAQTAVPAAGLHPTHAGASGPGEDGSPGAAQVVDVSQQSRARARGVQDGVVNRSTTRNRLRVDATASADATAVQEIQQVAGGAGGASQWAGQLSRVGQVADAASFGLQTGGLESEAVREASATAAAHLEAEALQRSAQWLTSTDGSAPAQWSGQHLEVGQQAGATATTEQAGIAGGAAASTATGEGIAEVGQDVEQLAALTGGEVSQWAGQLALVDQLLRADAAVAQSTAAGLPVVWEIGDETGSSPATDGPARAGARAVASDLAVATQSAHQGALRSAGVGEQTSTQLVDVVQAAVASAATTQQVGGGGALATSDALATNRSLSEQLLVQAQTGSSALDLQESAQEVGVEQRASAASTSAGGIGGSALATNCSIVDQVAGQQIGTAGPGGTPPGARTFCDPPSTPAPSSALGAAAPSPSAVALPPEAVGSPVQDVPEPRDSAPAVDDLAPLRGATHHAVVSAPQRAPDVAAAPFAPPTAPPLWVAPSNQVSTPHSTQARLDTRPGSIAGSEGTGREPPLPPVDGPPPWATALAAAASAAGSSGIAAILFAFALMPALWLRARDGSVVRRPTSAFAELDVPV